MIQKIHRLPMVYTLTTEGFEYIKIGMTKNIKNRMRNIQSGCPFKLSLWVCAYTKNPAQVEAEIHDKMEKFRLHGEWFSPDENALDEIMNFFSQKNKETRVELNALL